MTRGKKLEQPQLKLVAAENMRYTSLDEVWQVVGPLLAQLLAVIIKREQAKKGKRR